MNTKIPFSRVFTLTLIVILSSTTQLQASSREKILQQANSLKLYNHPIWLKLLHYEKDGKHSSVLTSSFFLDKNGMSNPKAELEATINEYFAPWGNDCNAHARCRFPARYYWLSQYLPLPDYNLREPKCQRLQKWALFDKVESISVILVSSFLGNPASTFGHVFLKLNTSIANDATDLFDSSVNYGALVPDKENPLLYVVRGLFGGYKAGFSDKYFYTQDRVYSGTEFRDMWAYKLALTDYQRRLLILHIWEIVGNKFAYYFLNKNCAYKLAELLEIVIDDNLSDNGRFWYLPVDLIFHLRKIGDSKKQNKKGKLIQCVNFIPSHQRILYHQLNSLKPNEIKAFNDIIRDRSLDDLKNFTPDRQIHILDSLIAYLQYKIVSEEPHPSTELNEFKRQALLARLLLPSYEIALPDIQPIPSPADLYRPMTIGFNVSSKIPDKFYFLLNWSPFNEQKTAKDYLEGDEFVVLDIDIGFRKYKAFLDQVNLVQVLNLNTMPVPIKNENQHSWQLYLTVNRIASVEKDRYDTLLGYGLGYAWQLNKNSVTYGMIDVVGHTTRPLIRLRPHLNLKFNLQKVNAHLYFGMESVDYDFHFKHVWGGNIKYHLNDRYSIDFEFYDERSNTITFGITTYW